MIEELQEQPVQADALVERVVRRFTTRVETSIEGLRRYAAQLDALGARAMEVNVFYEPCLLFPALENYAGQEKLIFLLIFADFSTGDDDEEDVRLCGFFPMIERERFRGLPLRHLVLWRCDNIYLSTPLVDSDHGAQVLHRALAWFRGNRHYKLLVASQLSAGGEFHRRLSAALDTGDTPHTCEPYKRAILHLEKDFDTYMARHVSSSMRKQLRRKDRRLAETGVVEYRTLQSKDDLEEWLWQFVHLEASGYKSSFGAAIANSDEAKRFLVAAARRAFAQQKLKMMALLHEGHVIAMAINLYSGQGAFAFKVAYDEHYAKYSPGVLLDLEMIRRLHAERRIRWLDSCTDPDVEVYDGLFSGHKLMRNLVVSNNGLVANTLLRLLPLTRRLKQAHKARAARTAAARVRRAPVSDRSCHA